MKKSKLFLELCLFVFLSSILVSFGKIENTPLEKNKTPKIVNTYSTVVPNSESIMVAANVKDFLGNSISETNNSYLEFNMDTDEDNKEDIIIQAFSKNGRIYFYSPINTNSKKLDQKALQPLGNVIVTPLDTEPITFQENGMYFYAGIKQIEVPSLFDFITSTFSASNRIGMQEVVTIAIKLPKTIIGDSNTTIRTWVTVKKK